MAGLADSHNSYNIVAIAISAISVQPVVVVVVVVVVYSLIIQLQTGGTHSLIIFGLSMIS